MRDFSRIICFTALLFAACACSSSNGLRKFDDGDLTQVMSADSAKKFEVKDVGATPIPSPTPAVEETKVSKKKHKTKKEKATAKAKATPSPTPVSVPNRRVDPMPFDVGEKLEYSIRFVGVPAGSINFEVLPLKQLEDRKVYQLRGRAKTVKIFEFVYRVDDTVESLFDYEGLFSHKYTMDLDESKQNRKLIELYDYDKKEVYYWDRIDHVNKGFSEKKETHDIALRSQDSISSLYYIRTLKLPTDPAQEVRIPVVLDGKPWELVLHYKKRTKMYAGGQDREADEYRLDTYKEGQLKNADNTIWLSTDAKRYVLRVEAKIKVGSFAVALDKVL